MTITQTVEIPVSHRLTIDVPREIPSGRTNIIVQFPDKKRTQQEVDEWVNPLFGLGKTMGSTLTLDRFMEMQNEEISLEIENDQKLWGK